MKSLLNKHIVKIFFLILFIFIVFNTTRTPGFFDSAEFAISYINNSITHPPSYPFSYIFNKSIGMLLPFHVMWKLHFVNELYSFLALIFFYLFLSFYTKNKFLKIIFVLQLFLGDYFLNYTFNLEVYSLLFLFTSIFLYIYEKTLRDHEYIHLLIFIFAMGLVVQPLFIFLSPFLIHAYFKSKKYKYLPLHILLGISPLLVYFIFWGLAKQVPIYNWEDTHDLSSLITIILRKGFKTVPFFFHFWGLHLVGLNVLKNTGIILFFIPLLDYKKNAYRILFILSYLIIISLTFSNVTYLIFDWAAFFTPVYMILFAISAKKLERFKYKWLLLIFPLSLFILNNGYIPYGKNPFPNAYYNDVNNHMPKNGKNIVFINEDSLGFIYNLKLVQKDTNAIPILLPLAGYNWYIKSLKKYTPLKFPKGMTSVQYKVFIEEHPNKKISVKNNVYNFYTDLKNLNPEYNFYITQNCSQYFTKLGEIPPFILIKLTDKGFKIPDYKNFAFLKPKPRNTFEYNSFRNMYDVFLKNATLYYISKNIKKAKFYCEKIKKHDADYYYMMSLIYLKMGDKVTARYYFKKIKK